MFIIGPDDIDRWFKDQAKCLQEKRYKDLDEELLIEYLLDESNQNYKSLRSHLEILIMHMLKYKYQPLKQSRSWINTIRNQRREIRYILDDGSKNNLIKEINKNYNKIWNQAIKDAINETRENKNKFPIEIEWDFNIILELDIEDFLTAYVYSDEAKRELNII